MWKVGDGRWNGRSLGIFEGIGGGFWAGNGAGSGEFFVFFEEILKLSEL